MDAAKLQELRQQLMTMQSRLDEETKQVEQGRMDQARPAGELSSDHTHDADQDVEGLQKQVTVAQTLRGEQQAVYEALDRIQQGGYGKCTECGKEIALERLEAIPHTPYCKDCAEKQQ